MSSTREAVKRFITDLALPGQRATDIADDTPLNERGVLDSLGTMQLIAFLEQTFHIEVEPDDLLSGRLSTLASIEQLVEDRARERA